MKPLAAPAIEAVRDGRTTFHPKRWENVYFHWMENIRDWCISRQLWWGHRIPVFYCDDVRRDGRPRWTTSPTCPKCGSTDVRQDEDVLDTWFSSQLWPFATLGWPEKTPELDYFYPTNVLSTARDILFLWVARMVMSGMDFIDGEIPFHDVIIHPTVFNAEGKRMSKSLGTGVDPLDLMDHYGADGMRFGLMLQVTGAQDLKFSEDKLLSSSRNFANKIWNASRFVMMNLEGYEPGAPEPREVADRWILSRLAELSARVDEGIDTYEFGETARALYDFFWNEFCDWYIELAKGRLNGGDAEQRASVQRILVFVLDQALRLLHPMMPFVTEAIWRNLPLAEAGRRRLAHDRELARRGRARALRRPGRRGVDQPADRDRRRRARRARPLHDPAEARARHRHQDHRRRREPVGQQRVRPHGITRRRRRVRGRHRSPRSPRTPRRCSRAAWRSTSRSRASSTSTRSASGSPRSARRPRSSSTVSTRSSRNEGFLAKAAPEIIEKDRARADELGDQLALIDAQLAELA